MKTILKLYKMWWDKYHLTKIQNSLKKFINSKSYEWERLQEVTQFRDIICKGGISERWKLFIWNRRGVTRHDLGVAFVSAYILLRMGFFYEAFWPCDGNWCYNRKSIMLLSDFESCLPFPNHHQTAYSLGRVTRTVCQPLGHLPTCTSGCTLCQLLPHSVQSR